MMIATHRPASKNAHSAAWPAALSANPPATTRTGEKRSRTREKVGTSATVAPAVTSVISGRAAAGHAVRNAASRSAFPATWCAIIVAAVAMASAVKTRFKATGGSRGSPGDVRPRARIQVFAARRRHATAVTCVGVVGSRPYLRIRT
jgi:hypothetical protein